MPYPKQDRLVEQINISRSGAKRKPRIRAKWVISILSVLAIIAYSVIICLIARTILNNLAFSPLPILILVISIFLAATIGPAIFILVKLLAYSIKVEDWERNGDG